MNKNTLKGWATLIWIFGGGIAMVVITTRAHGLMPATVLPLCVWLGGMLMTALIRFIKNQLSPEKSLPGKVVHHYCRRDDDGTSYHTGFLLEDGTRIGSNSRELYYSVNACDYGSVSFKGTRFTGFKYAGGVSMTDIPAFITGKQNAGTPFDTEYMITFRSDALDTDGHQITLECSKEDYHNFKTGEDGLLTFERGIFRSFVTKKY